MRLLTGAAADLPEGMKMREPGTRSRSPVVNPSGFKTYINVAAALPSQLDTEFVYPQFVADEATTLRDQIKNLRIVGKGRLARYPQGAGPASS
jgi:hypothetical protein